MQLELKLSTAVHCSNFMGLKLLVFVTFVKLLLTKCGVYYQVE